MTLTEKIANARKRINELEALIDYWDKKGEKIPVKKDTIPNYEWYVLRAYKPILKPSL